MNSNRHREADDGGEFVPAPAARIATVVLVAAVYIYFLIFAQFGFLGLLREFAGEEGAATKRALAAMGAGGIGASFLTARFFHAAAARRWLGATLGLAAAAAGLALVVPASALLLVAVLAGAGLGGTTVALAASVARVTGRRRLGLVLGAGTGCAYAFCNLPAVFQATPTTQTLVAVAAGGLALLALAGFKPRTAGNVQANDCGAGGTAPWVIVFLLLVGLDSAAFYVIQHNPALQAGTWAEGARLHANAALHLGAALLAGWLLDRGRLAPVALLAALALATACSLLASRPGLAASVYVAGVSLYSTALVFYPAASGRAGVAATFYAVAGWLGSGLGIGLVAQRTALPGWLGWLVLAAVTGTLATRRWMNKN